MFSLELSNDTNSFESNSATDVSKRNRSTAEAKIPNWFIALAEIDQPQESTIIKTALHKKLLAKKP